MSPLVSAIVLFHNESSAREAAECIDALQKQSIADQIEIIPVNNGASDEVNSLLLGPPKPHQGEGGSSSTSSHPLILSHNLGYGAGNNRGAAQAIGTYILIINPDNRLEHTALETMVRYLEEHPDTGLVSPKLVFPDGSLRDSFRSFPNPVDLIIKRTPLRYIFKKRMARYLQWNEDPHTIRDVDWMSGACLLLSKKLYDELGGFDERFFLFLEDCDLCRRIWEQGLRVVYLPTAMAHDQKQRLSGGGILSLITKRTVRIHVASALKYFWKWRGKALPALRRDI
jgi:GT2 family glycosyltransferase